MLVHYHTIVNAKVKKAKEEISCQSLVDFLNKLVLLLGMKKIFDPIVIDGKFGFTGVVGIVTSHIAFHYFDHDCSLKFDVYSCKKYNLNTLVGFLDAFWLFENGHILFVHRDNDFCVKKYIFKNSRLAKVG